MKLGRDFLGTWYDCYTICPIVIEIRWHLVWGGGHTAPAMTRVLRLVILANENRNLRNIYRVTAQRLYRAFSTD